MLTTKPTVRFAAITPALLRILTVVERLSRTLPGVPDAGLVITAGSDGTHMTGSKHYIGEAIDLRSKTLHEDVRALLVTALSEELGDAFTVLLEDAGASNEHIHVQTRRGRRFS